ncbi:hypothetical protein [Streptomyces sp. NPDC016172]
MDRHKSPQCDVPTPTHSGPVRPYHCGPRCTLHAPKPRNSQPQKETTT